MKAKTTSPETKEFLSDVADKLESAASNLECSAGSAIIASCAISSSASSRYLNANFASKMVYTACYTLSYGICFPVFMACHYIPKNNNFVEGLIDGGASANQSADDMIERSKAKHLARQEAAEESQEFKEVVSDGVGCLSPA